jgi:EAL domain-containing protein (putative c-di-GMP-specific phosphodiesterase class I)
MRAAAPRADHRAMSSQRHTAQHRSVAGALEHPGRLRMAFQPIVGLAVGMCCAYEALARFPGLAMPPAAVFSAAHACGFGPELEALTVDRALAAPGRPTGTGLCVNVSPSVLDAAALWRVLPDDLGDVIVEVTEHELCVTGGQLERALDALRMRGARIAVDDVGSGYAGLCQLVRVRPDIVKVDRALIQGVHADPTRTALVDALSSFAHDIGTELWAEGVEDPMDLATLAELGVDAAQGFLLGRPGDPWPAPRADLLAAATA